MTEQSTESAHIDKACPECGHKRGAHAVVSVCPAPAAQVECLDCGNVPGGDGCRYSSTCPCTTCGTAAYCDGSC